MNVSIQRAPPAYDGAQIHANSKRGSPPPSGGPDIMFEVQERPILGVIRDEPHAFADMLDLPEEPTTPPEYFDIPDHKAIVREGTNGKPLVLGVVGAGYEPIQNTEFFPRIDKAVDQISSNHVDLTKSSYGGAWCAKQYVFPDIKEHIPQANYGDTYVDFSIEARNGHDGGTRISYGCSSIDGFCDNSLVYLDKEFIRRKHTSGIVLPNVDTLYGIFQSGLDAFRAQCEVIRLWADKQITNDQARDLLADLPGISERRQLKFLARFEHETATRGSTLWALASALTFYSSHNSDEFGVRGAEMNDNVARTLANRQAQVLVWFNSNAWKAAAKA